MSKARDAADKAPVAATLTGTETLENKTLDDPILTLDGSEGTAGQVPVSQGPGQAPVWGDIDVGGDVFTLTDMGVKLSDNFSHWVTSDLIIIRDGTTVYVINKATKTLANTYTYSGLVDFKVFDDTLAVGCTNSVVFKVTISGTTLTRGTDSNALPTTNPGNTSYSSGTIQIVCVMSATQAVIGANYRESGGVEGASIAAAKIS